jgi:hypothetical protein
MEASLWNGMDAWMKKWKWLSWIFWILSGFWNHGDARWHDVGIRGLCGLGGMRERAAT